MFLAAGTMQNSTIKGNRHCQVVHIAPGHCYFNAQSLRNLVHCSYFHFLNNCLRVFCTQ